MIKQDINIQKATFLHLSTEAHYTSQLDRRKPFTHKTGFNTQAAHMGFVVDKIATGHGILPQLLFPMSI
jgi:hypothetical protein